MKTYQLVGIGNAVVDVITRSDDSFLAHMGIEKGIMQLIEKDTGCNAMLRDNKTEDLKRMFKLFHRCGPSSITPLAEIFRKHVEEVLTRHPGLAPLGDARPPLQQLGLHVSHDGLGNAGVGDAVFMLGK